jgi:hypothetical protein
LWYGDISWQATKDACNLKDLGAENGAAGGYFYPVGVLFECIFSLSFDK